MSAITNLEPRIVWEQFDAITRVPRPSKKEGRIIEFLVDFARKHNLEYKKDAIGNLVMRNPATPGFENRPTVILQSHMDMVCEKNSDVEFDFDRDPIRTRIDGGWVRAEGTTLGADCGIGMAAALEDRSGRSWRYLPKHAGQVQVGVVFALAKPHGVGGAIDRKRDGDMPCVMRKRPTAAPAKEQTAEKAQQYDENFTHLRFGRRQEQRQRRPHAGRIGSPQAKPLCPSRNLLRQS